MMDSPFAGSSEHRSSPAASSRGKRSRELSSPSQRHSKRRSVPANELRAETVDGPALPNKPLPIPPPAAKEEEDGETKAGEEVEAVDDDWGSVIVEEELQQSQSQDDEQAVSSQQQMLSPHSPTTTSESHDNNSASTQPTSTTTTTSSNTHTPVQQPLTPSTATSLSSHPTQPAPSSRMALMRLQSDLKVLEHDPPEGISASPVDLTNPLEGGVFQLQLVFPKEYPQKPPQVRFLSKVFHPNVFADGNICLDILSDKWSPIYTVSSLLSSIQSLLTDPNNASPANQEAARLLANDIKEYRKRVRQCAAKATQ